MPKRWALAGVAVIAAVAAIGGVIAMAAGQKPLPAAAGQPATVTVQRSNLSDTVTQYGILTYRAGLDGSPYAVINQAHGTYTELPAAGHKIACADVLYRVDDLPVLLLCGAIPAFRNLQTGDTGNDVRQLNWNLHERGYNVAPDNSTFTPNTQDALKSLQQEKGLPMTGALAFAEAVFLPEPVRITKVAVVLGGSAQPGAEVAQATSNSPEVQVPLDPAQQGSVKRGDRAQIILPANQSVTGKVERVGSVTEGPTGPDGKPGNVTFPIYITLDDPGQARGLDQAPVRVDITTVGVDNVLSVPVTAIVGKSGGGFAVEVVGNDGRRALVAVKLGLFDTADGRVQVDGAVREGDHVVVPSL